MHKLTLSDIICPICLNVIIHPVTMPCKHELCLPCFKLNVAEANLECTMCRTRISSWARKAARENSLINEERWKKIQRAFPEKVYNRLNGVEDDISIEEFHQVPNPLSQPGEIRKEYEEQLQKFQKEEAREREQEAKASEELIQQLQYEELQMIEKKQAEQEVIAANDEIIAVQLFKKINQLDDSAILSSMLKDLNSFLNNIPGLSDSDLQPELPRSANDSASASSTNIKDCILASTSQVLEFSTKGSSNLRSTSVDSHDSITSEMRHFKPIIAAPKTPPKRMADGRLFEPVVVLTKVKKLDFSVEEEANKVINLREMEDTSGPFVIHSSTPFTGADRAHKVCQKQSIDYSCKENYPFYVDSSPILQRSKRPAEPQKSSKKNRRFTFPPFKNVRKRTRERIHLNSKQPKLGNANTNGDSEADDSVLAMDTSNKLHSRSLQEAKDRKLALNLHKELNCSHINRSEGSGNEYNLRIRPRRKKAI